MVVKKLENISSKRMYPQWFIDELVNEEDKEKARNRTLKSTEKVKFKCEKGHIYEQVIHYHIKLSTGERNRGCPICGKKKNIENMMKTVSSKRVYPQWFIDELVNKDDKAKARCGILMNTSRVKFKCNNGHIYEQRVYDHIRLSTHKRRYGCPICGKENRMKTISSKRTYPDWFINELVNEDDKEKARNGTLVTKSKVEFKCDNGHIYEQSVSDHIKLSTGEKKNSCPICGKIKNVENRMKTVSSKRTYPDWFINELVNEEDKEKARCGILMNTSRVKFMCNNGHIYEQVVGGHIKISTAERKKGCPICGKEKGNENRMKTISDNRIYPEWFIDELVNEEDKEKARNGTLMNNSKVEFRCERGHIYEQRVYCHIKLSTGEKKQGCPSCSNFRSRPELELENYIKSLGYNVEHRRFKDSTHKRFEIDIFIPEKNVGIEYCGSYYHASEHGHKDLNKEYHFTKYSECRKKNILLITIFDIEWEQKEHKIKQYIKDILVRKENELSYDKDGYMNNNYPSWKYYKHNGEYIEDHYVYNEKQTVYTCGYTTL